MIISALIHINPLIPVAARPISCNIGTTTGAKNLNQYEKNNFNFNFG